LLQHCTQQTPPKKDHSSKAALGKDANKGQVQQRPTAITLQWMSQQRPSAVTLQWLSQQRPSAVTLQWLSQQRPSVLAAMGIPAKTKCKESTDPASTQ